MKKFVSIFAAGILAVGVFCLSFSGQSADRAADPTAAACAESLQTETLTAASDALPAESTDAAAPSLHTVALEETEKWILDEILSDYVSEDVVELTEAGYGYQIGDWVERDFCTYLLFDKETADGTLYTAAGYAQTADGSYVYFELVSPQALTQQQIEVELTKAFGGTTGESQSC